MTVTAQASRFRWLVLIAAILGYITLQVDNLSITPVLPHVAASLNIDLGTASNLAMTTFLFAAFLVLLLAGGVVCDKLGVIAAIMMGSLCAAAPMALMPWIGHSGAGLAVARFIEGCSAGFMFPAMGPIIGLWFPDHQKGLAGGLMSASVAVGSAAGVLLGPAVLAHVSNWQAMNAVLSIFGWVTFAFALVLACCLNPLLSRMADRIRQPSSARFFLASHSSARWWPSWRTGECSASTASPRPIWPPINQSALATAQ